MKKFSFRLQTKLDIDSRLKQEATEKYIVAMHQEDEALEQLNSIVLRESRLREKIKDLRQEEFLLAKLSICNEYFRLLNSAKDAQQEEVNLLHLETEKAREKLLEQTREVKMLERLKTKAWQQYQQELLKTEQIELDEISGISYIRKNQA